MLCLKQIGGRTYNPSLQPEIILLKPTVTRFGRSDKHADVVIDSSVSPLMISRLHAVIIHFDDGKFRIDCKGLNGLLVNQTKRSSAVLCDGDEIVFGGAGVKTKEGQSLFVYDSELVYVFKQEAREDTEEAGSLGEGTSDGRVLRRSKRKQPVPITEELSGPSKKKNTGKYEVKSKEVPEDEEKKKTIDTQENNGSKEEERSKKCLADLNEELLCCICRELMVLAHTLPCSHTFCFGCIRDWLGQSSDCPNCRAHAQLQSAVPVKVLDNTINKVAEEVLSAEELQERQVKIQEMQEEAKQKKPKKITVLSSTSSSDSDLLSPDSSIDSSPDSSPDSSVEEVDIEFHDHRNSSYGVEYARSGRARCRTCHSLIPNCSLRWVVQSNARWNYYRPTYYHHLECFYPPRHITFEMLSISSELIRDDKRSVRERLTGR